jgi:hypothetical protein
MVGVSSSGRVPELLDALRAEYESLQQECAFLKHHREDFDSKSSTECVVTTCSLILCGYLVYDLGVVQKVIYDLEKNHIRAKQQY